MKKLLFILFLLFGLTNINSQNANKYLEYNSDKATFLYSDKYTLTDYRVLNPNIDIKLVINDSGIIGDRDNIVMDIEDSSPAIEERIKDDNTFAGMSSLLGFALKRTTLYNKEILVLNFSMKGRSFQQYIFIENKKFCTITVGARNSARLEKMLDDMETILKTIAFKR